MYSCEITKQNTWPVQTAGQLRQWQGGAYTRKTDLPDCHRRPSVSGRTESPSNIGPGRKGHRARAALQLQPSSAAVPAAVGIDRDGYPHAAFILNDSQ